jgi:hypothetical protein
MIDRQHGLIVFECDACEETCETGFDEWVDAWPCAKREGWKSRKIDGEWIHTCPECSE